VVFGVESELDHPFHELPGLAAGKVLQHELLGKEPAG
jgi:hypothetical protein